MTALAYYLLKVILCSGVLFLYYQLLLRNRLFHEWNRFYLLFSVLVSLVVPLFQFTVWHQQEVQSNAWDLLRSLQQADHRMQEFIVVSNQGLSQDEWLLLAYSLVSLCFLFAFLFALRKLQSIIRRHSYQQLDRVRLIQTELPGTPFSFFRYIFWNRGLSLQSETGRQIFQHELVHVTERHTLDKLLLQVTLIFFWCNPFFWLIRKELHDIHEFIADKKAVGANNASALAALLLQTAYPQQFASFTNAFFHSSIKRRLMMLKKKPSLSYAGRIMALPFATLLLVAFTVRTKVLPTTDHPFALPTAISTDTLPKKEIQSVSVNKKADTTLTITYKDGTKKTYTQKEAEKEGLLKEQKKTPVDLTSKSTAPKPLYIVDGKEYNNELDNLDPKNIESINVLKGETATKKYGKKGENGVVEITLKKEANSVTQLAEPIFEKAETPASIDPQEWRAFLAKNLQPIIVNAASKGAKPGNYTVNVQFLVRKDGSLSDFKALNDPGYDFDKQILAVMPNSPKWKPAEQNGKVVNSFHTQPITFVIAEQ